MADPSATHHGPTAHAHSSTSSGTLTFTGASDGDLLLVILHSDGTHGAITWPSGNTETWAQWQSYTHGSSTCQITVGYLIANGEGTNPGFSFSWATGQGVMSHHMTITDTDASYLHSDTSWQGQWSFEDESSSNNYTTPSVTTDTDGELVFAIGGTQDATSGGPSTWTNSFTEQFDERSGSGTNNVRLCGATKTQTTAGAVGTVNMSSFSVGRAGLSGQFSIEHAPAASGTTIEPGAVATTVAVPGPTVTATADITPGAVATVIATPAPTVTATADINAGVVNEVIAVPAPTITTAITPQPGVVAQTVAVPGPTITATADVAAGVVGTVTAVPAPTVTATADIGAGVVAETIAVPSVTVTATADVPAGAVAQTVAVPGPTVTATADISAGAVATTIAVPAASVVVGTFIFPGTTDLVVAVPGPTVTASATVPAAAVAQVVAVPSPTIQTVEGPGEPSNKEWDYYFHWRRRDMR